MRTIERNVSERVNDKWREEYKEYKMRVKCVIKESKMEMNENFERNLSGILKAT